jgi:hypothetical protein
MIAKACLMLVLCSAGAGLGLLLALPPAGLCLTSGHGLWMQGGMVVGGLVAMLSLAADERRHGASWRRALCGADGFNLACHGAMVAAMAAFSQAGAMLAAMAAATALVTLSYSVMHRGA